MLTLLPKPFRHLLFNQPQSINSLALEVFAALALLMIDSVKLQEAQRALLMLGPPPADTDFRPLEDLHKNLSQIGPGFAALLEESLESGEIYVESPLHINAYSPAIRDRLKPLQIAADRLNALDESDKGLHAARIVVSCLKDLYPKLDITEWLSARGCSKEILSECETKKEMVSPSLYG
ncbi:MAG: hypothetical protein JKY15_00245 [Deltaproteobacteria bacterium]|nr:hypothetical protein [Deltaproteobacteria bacterium]